MAEQAPINIKGAVVERVESFKFLCIHIPNELSWSKHTKTVVKRARQNLLRLRRLKRFAMGPHIIKSFYSCSIESILTGYITAWYGNSASDRKVLQSVGSTAQYITGAKLPAIQDQYNRRCQMKAHTIFRDSRYRLFSLLPQSKRYRSTKSTVGPKGSSTACPPMRLNC